MKKLGLFVMVKNEKEFINHFIDHNSPIFDEITIIDNGSTDGTLEIIKKYESDKFKIFESLGKYDKSGICSEHMRNSNADILVPLDADELIVYDDGDVKNISNNVKKIRSYLQSLPTKQEGFKFKINRIFQKHPEHEDWWGFSDMPKVFFTKNGFISTDNGNHNGQLINKENAVPVNLSYLDYRYFCFEYWEKRTIEKLKSRLKEKWNEIDSLAKHSLGGLDGHAAREYLAYLGWRVCKGCGKTKNIELFANLMFCKDCKPGLYSVVKRRGQILKKGYWNKVKNQIKFDLK